MEHFYKSTEGENWFNYEDLYREFVNNAKPEAHFVEVGTWKGRSACYMGVEIANSGKKIQFDCVDTWQPIATEKDIPEELYIELYSTFLRNIAPVTDYITPVHAVSWEGAALYADESLDVVFIDAAHDYESVTKDLKAWYPKVKKGGVFAGHDYRQDCGVFSAVNDFFEGHHTVTKKGPCWAVELPKTAPYTSGIVSTGVIHEGSHNKTSETCNPLGVFDKVYCINLDERVDRWQRCLKEFEDLKVANYERFPALRVTTLPNGQSGEGRHGHTKTYCAVIDKAIEHEFKSCLILEDDFHFEISGIHLREALDKAIGQLPDDWDVLYLGANIHTIYTTTPLQSYSSELFKLNSAYATHAVVFSWKGLRALRNCFSPSKDWHLEYLEKSAATDLFLAKDFLPKSKAFITSTLLANQVSDYSDIENEYKDYTQMLRENFTRHKTEASKSVVTFDSYRDFKGYVINLDRERWRYDATRKELTSLGFTNIKRWKATDYKEEDVEAEMLALGTVRLDRFYNCAEMACVLSHLRAMHDFLAGSEPYCFIFEDDVVAVPNFKELADFHDIKYGEFDLLCFGGAYASPDYGTWKPGTPIWNTSNLTPLREAVQNKSTHVSDCCFWMAHAYMLSRKGAHNLTRDYAAWAGSSEYRIPFIDVYMSSHRGIKNKLLINRNIPNIAQYTSGDKFAERFCGIMFQRANYKSTIVNAQ
jgi:GR25 family glycosyltransferase involved in LPS biosynthesis